MFFDQKKACGRKHTEINCTIDSYTNSNLKVTGNAEYLFALVLNSVVYGYGKEFIRL